MPGSLRLQGSTLEQLSAIEIQRCALCTSHNSHRTWCVRGEGKRRAAAPLPITFCFAHYSTKALQALAGLFYPGIQQLRRVRWQILQLLQNLTGIYYAKDICPLRSQFEEAAASYLARPPVIGDGQRIARAHCDSLQPPSGKLHKPILTQRCSTCKSNSVS